ncbi:MAG TPA: hypothetical protein PK771_08840, partial [Spirochaetota bacterium]|nr:hypothetical protein [Spirochaetota bacterium]
YKFKKYSNISDNAAYYIDTVIDDNEDIIIAYKDFAHKNRLSAKKISNNLIDYLGKPAFSDLDCLYNKIIIKNGNIPIVAYSDFSVNNRLTVNMFINNNWNKVGEKGISDFQAENIDIVCDKNGNIIVVYSEKNSFVLKTFISNQWITLYKHSCNYGTFESVTDSIKLVIDKNNNPIIIYPDPDNNFRLTIVSNILTNPKEVFLSEKSSRKPSVAIDPFDNIYVLTTEIDENIDSKTVIYKIFNDKIIKTINFKVCFEEYSLSIAKENRILVAYQNPEKNNTLSIISFCNDKYEFKKDYLSRDFITSIKSDSKNNKFVISFQDYFYNDKAGCIVIEFK